MQSMTLPLIKLRFEMEAMEDINFPSHRGSTFRGSFGNALKDTVPHNIYLQIFESTNYFRSKKYNTSAISVPNPYIFETADFSEQVLKGQIFDFCIMLFGVQMANLEYVTNAVVKSAEYGFTYERKKARVFRIYQVSGDGSEKLLYDGQHIIIPSHLDKHFTVTYPQHINCVEINFLTPTRIMHKHEPLSINEFNAYSLIKSLISRVDLLYSLYSYEPFSDPDFYNYLEYALEEIEIYDKNLEWRECARYSNRQVKVIDLSGVMGNIILVGRGLNYISKYLAAGIHLHVGHATVMGLGQYKLNYIFA